MEQKLPAYQTLMPNVVEALRELGGTAKVGQIDDFIFNISNFPDDSKKELKKRLIWSRTYLKKYGLIDNPKKGQWILSKTYATMNAGEIKKTITEAEKQYYNR